MMLKVWSVHCGWADWEITAESWLIAQIVARGVAWQRRRRWPSLGHGASPFRSSSAVWGGWIWSPGGIAASAGAASPVTSWVKNNPDAVGSSIGIIRH